MHSGGDTVTRFGATILDAEGLRLSPAEKAFFRDVRPFGFILFARNIDTPDQVRALCDELRETVGYDCPITIDQEGGRVQRLSPPHWRDWPAPLDHILMAGDCDAEVMYLRYRLIAHELRALGVDSNCAPLVDLAGPDTHPFLKNRCYGGDAATVAAIGRAVADGLLDGGVLPVVKHIPGHGRAVVDSHIDLPHVDTTLDALSGSDFVPFRALNDLPMAMTAHVVYSQINEAPATMSARMMQVIREDIGFDGLVMTDDIAMKALRGTLVDITRSALGAGCDVVLHCNGSLVERIETAHAAGEMTDRAQARAERVHSARRPPAEIDVEALEARLTSLMNGQA